MLNGVRRREQRVRNMKGDTKVRGGRGVPWQRRILTAVHEESIPEQMELMHS